MKIFKTFLNLIKSFNVFLLIYKTTFNFKHLNEVHHVKPFKLKNINFNSRVFNNNYRLFLNVFKLIPFYNILYSKYVCSTSLFTISNFAKNFQKILFLNFFKIVNNKSSIQYNYFYKNKTRCVSSTINSKVIFLI
jgi:hypothetical protein